MDDLEHAILDAWDRVKAKVLSDPVELQRRLARRERPVLLRPPRTWCLAVRASDRRLRGPLVRVDPEEATHPSYNDGHVLQHEVMITTDALRTLCEPVYIDGLTIDQAAARLGRTQGNLVHTRIKGTLRSKYVEGLGGWWGKPRPILYADRPLDPTMRGFEPADEAWDWTAQFYPHRVPENFSQTIVRIPLERPRAGQRYRDTRGLHPEHPLLDPGDGPPPKRQHLPPAPTQDICAWYKWKGDEYIGYDWRNPYAKANYERHQREKAMARAAAKARRQRNGPARSRSTGSLVFKGWRWLCPRCGRRVSVLYCPLASVNLLANWPGACDELARAGVAIDAPQPAPALACDGCHQLRHITPGCVGFWNQLIAFLSAGLLYGSEVVRPSWLTLKRKVPYRPRGPRINGYTRRAPLPPTRRPAVQERLLKGWTYKRIAADLGISPPKVRDHAHKIYKRHGVHRRAELARQLGVTLPATTMGMKRQQIIERLAQGQSYHQIAAAIGSTCEAVRVFASELRRKVRDAGTRIRQEWTRIDTNSFRI